MQGEPGVLATVAAYIDLNAVRAGVVKDPREWRWCGYAEARTLARKRVTVRPRLPAAGLTLESAPVTRAVGCITLAAEFERPAVMGVGP